MSARIWLCNTCGVTGPWTDSWSWYGSLKEMEDGDPVPTFCSEKCQVGPAGLAEIRKGLRRDPHFVFDRDVAAGAP